MGIFFRGFSFDLLAAASTKTKILRFSVLEGYSTGLVSKKKSPWNKDSIYIIATVEEDTSNKVDSWGIQITSRVTVSSVWKRNEYMLKNNRDRYFQIQDDKMSKFINNN